MISSFIGLENIPDSLGDKIHRDGSQHKPHDSIDHQGGGDPEKPQHPVPVNEDKVSDKKGGQNGNHGNCLESETRPGQKGSCEGENRDILLPGRLPDLFRRHPFSGRLGMQHVNGNGKEQYAAGNAQIVGGDPEEPQNQFAGHSKGDGNYTGHDYGPLGCIFLS